MAEVTPVSGGYLHQTFRVETPAGPLFLKRYAGPDWPAEKVAGTLAIQQHLHRTGLPVPAVLAGPVSAADGLLVAMTFLPGERALDPSPAHAAAAGTALGKVHQALAALPVTVSPLVPQADQIRTGAEGLLAAASSRPYADPMDRLAVTAARFRLDWLAQHPIEPDRYQAQTWQVVHGDYYPGNLLYTGAGQLSGIVDFDFAGPRFRSLELARATVEFGLTPDWRFQTEVAAAFLRAYLGALPLPPEERVGGFRVWLEYLLGSLYPLPLRYHGAPLPHGWERLAQRRHDLLAWLADHLTDLEQLARSV